MFRAEQLTDGDRQRRRAPRPHAVTIRQAAAATDQGGGECRILANYPAASGKMQDDLQKMGVVFVLYLIIRTERPAAGVFLAKSGGNGRHRHPLAAIGTT